MNLNRDDFDKAAERFVETGDASHMSEFIKDMPNDVACAMLRLILNLNAVSNEMSFLNIMFANEGNSPNKIKAAANSVNEQAIKFDNVASCFRQLSLAFNKMYEVIKEDEP